MILDCIAIESMSVRSVAAADLMQVCGWVIVANTSSVESLAIITSGHRLFGWKSIIFSENVSLGALNHLDATCKFHGVFSSIPQFFVKYCFVVTKFLFSLLLLVFTLKSE